MLKWVSSDTAGIGFGDLKKIRMVKLARVQTGTAAYWPTPGDVASGAYPLARTLGYLFRHKPSGGLQQYIEWVASQDETIREFGFVPVE